MKEAFLWAVGAWLVIPSLWAADLQIAMNKKILTPGGTNPTITFQLASAPDSAVETHVFDIKGRREGALTSVSPTQYTWSGRDEDGRVVESGIHLIQISQSNSRPWTGVVLVAR